MKEIQELRIQVTKKNKFPKLYDFDLFDSTETQLSQEEILAAVKAAADMGTQEIRLTGGEPLERKDLAELAEKIKAVEGIQRVSVTTNGIFLAGAAEALKAAGIDSVDIRLDTFFEEKYIYMTGGGPIDEVMDGMEAALKAEMKPVRVVATILKGLNDEEILNFGQLALNEPLDVVFLEKPNVEGEKLKDSEKALEFMGMEEIRSKFKGAVKIPSQDPLVDYYKWYEARSRIGFSGIDKGQEFGVEITAEGGLKHCLLDKTPKDIRGLLSAGDIAGIRRELEAL